MKTNIFACLLIIQLLVWFHLCVSKECRIILGTTEKGTVCVANDIGTVELNDGTDEKLIPQKKFIINFDEFESNAAIPKRNELLKITKAFKDCFSAPDSLCQKLDEKTLTSDLTFELRVAEAKYDGDYKIDLLGLTKSRTLRVKNEGAMIINIRKRRETTGVVIEPGKKKSRVVIKRGSNYFGGTCPPGWKCHGTVTSVACKLGSPTCYTLVTAGPPTFPNRINRNRFVRDATRIEEMEKVSGKYFCEKIKQITVKVKTKVTVKNILQITSRSIAALM